MLVPFVQLQSVFFDIQSYEFIIGNVQDVILVPVIEDVIRHLLHMLDSDSRGKAMPLVYVAVEKMLREV